MRPEANATRKDGRKIVWILGAGFSKGLGGPLIYDLLAHRERSILEGLVPKGGGLVEDNYLARGIFGWGRKQGYWDHAEQFLDLVEEAAANPDSGDHSHARRFLERTCCEGAGVRFPEKETVLGANVPGVYQDVPTTPHKADSLKALARACRRALITDCSSFLRAASPTTERWEPYVSWARELGPNDTVITFNYDSVPDLLARNGGRLRVVLPFDANATAEKCRDTGLAPVLKLHGSVNWVLDGAEKVRAVEPPESWHLLLEDQNILIGVPGPGKRAACEVLDVLWTSATAALREAQTIVFIGYRFPPTDGDSRRRLLGAIRLNPNDGFRTVTVLGPTSPDSPRILRMLEAAVDGRGAAPDIAPLFAEDYLAMVWPMALLDRRYEPTRR